MTSCWRILRRRVGDHYIWVGRDAVANFFVSTEASLEAARTKFDRTLTTTRTVSTRGVQWFLPFWYSKEPMFWLPYGWFPYYIEWFASFPRAPMGSVSIVVWQWACTAVIALMIEAATAALVYVAAKQSQKVRQPVPAQSEKKDS